MRHVVQHQHCPPSNASPHASPYAAVGEGVVEKLHFPENTGVLIVWEEILLHI